MAWSEPEGAALDLPPLLSGEAADEPFSSAITRARAGCDAGLILHDVRPDRLSAAIVLAPEVPVAEAMAMVLAAANAFGDAFGALAPSEVACQFDWPGGFRINGARCGRLRAAASTRDPETLPGWLVIGLELPFFVADDTGPEPGEVPDTTTFWEEGCAEIAPKRMLESWARHLLVWIHTWEEDGIRRLHADWGGRAFALGEDVAVDLPSGAQAGKFIGLDETGGMLLQAQGTTRLIPLTAMLEEV